MTKTIAIRDLALHACLIQIKKEKKFRTVEEAIHFLYDYYTTWIMAERENYP